MHRRLLHESSSYIGSIGDDYLQLWESGDNADVIFNVKDVEIKAHRTVLMARSSYFKTMFNANMNESTSGKINVPDADPGAFKSMNLDNITTQQYLK